MMAVSLTARLAPAASAVACRLEITQILQPVRQLAAGHESFVKNQCKRFHLLPACRVGGENAKGFCAGAAVF